MTSMTLLYQTSIYPLILGSHCRSVLCIYVINSVDMAAAGGHDDVIESLISCVKKHKLKSYLNAKDGELFSEVSSRVEGALALPMILSGDKSGE